MTECKLTTLQLLEIQRNELATDIHTPYKIGKYQLNSMCIETNLCQHYVTDTISGETYIMGKTNIFLLCLFHIFIQHG